MPREILKINHYEKVNFCVSFSAYLYPPPRVLGNQLVDNVLIPVSYIYSPDNGKTKRTPASILISCYYESNLSSIFVTFTSELESVDVEVNNQSTGEYLSGTISGAVGTQILPISGTAGFYTIYFTLSNGAQYYGEFEI